MPYLFLAIGILLGLYTLYRFLLRANTHQIKALLLSIVILVLIAALFFMAITGRLPAAIALLVAIYPFALSLWRISKGGKPRAATYEDKEPKTRKDALEILGLSGEVNDKDIKTAYKKLMAKVHPDHEGSEWMAAKLNQARDILLDKDTR